MGAGSPPGATCFRRRTAVLAQFIHARLCRHLSIYHALLSNIAYRAHILHPPTSSSVYPANNVRPLAKAHHTPTHSPLIPLVLRHRRLRYRFGQRQRGYGRRARRHGPGGVGRVTEADGSRHLHHRHSVLWKVVRQTVGVLGYVASSLAVKHSALSNYQ